MGYNLYITRKEDWSDETGEEITTNEWLNIINSDSSLTLSKDNGKYFTELKNSDGEIITWLDWDDGCIFTKNPKDSTIKKMISIANNLKATVQGEEGEEYNEDYFNKSEEIIQVVETNSKKDKPETKSSSSLIYIGLALVIVIVLLKIIKK